MQKLNHQKRDLPQGLLRRKEGEQKFQLSRYVPSEALTFFVEHHWIVQWHLQQEKSYRQENLPHPAINITFGQDQAQVYGVVKRKFSYDLKGQGCIVAVKFHPGGFYPFLQAPVSTLTNHVLTIQEVFGTQGSLWKKGELSLLSDQEKINRVENFLLERRPTQDENVLLIRSLVELIQKDREVLKVDDVVDRVHLGKRSLQRLFAQYVGASPKWVIQIFRLQQAAEQVAKDPNLSWVRLALELGYSDQAHFIRDFKAVVGVTPAQYAHQLDQRSLEAEEGRKPWKQKPSI